MAEMWIRRAAVIFLVLLPAACQAVERPETVLRRDFPGVRVNRIGVVDPLYSDYGDIAVLEGVHRALRAGVPKPRIEEVIVAPVYERPGAILHEPDGRPDAYDLWLRIAGCDKLVYMKARFTGRVFLVHDRGGCLKRASESKPPTR